MPSMTVQTPPPLNSSGVVLRSCQISASFPFQVPRAEFRLSTIQFPLPIFITSFLQKIHGDGFCGHPRIDSPLVFFNHNVKRIPVLFPKLLPDGFEYYEEILNKELTALDDQFTSLRYLSDELQIRARGLRVKKKAA